MREADAMFGARHYTNYHFLLTLSDRVAHFGLEHHQSNDSRVNENSLSQQNSIGVVAHEYVHSWNGKFRRPAELAHPDFQQPMVGDLLWVCEGLTQYLGYVPGRAERHLERVVLTRSGSRRLRRSSINEPGREWRPLSGYHDRGAAAVRSPGQWTACRRDARTSTMKGG